MPQQTAVLKLDASEGERLEAALQRGIFEFRSVPHAAFSAKGDGVVVTLYRSGKLVVQGADPAAFTARYLDRVPEEKRDEPIAGVPLDRELIGGDESGKGDFIGPLAVAAIRIAAGDLARLTEGGVMDSKKISDKKIHQMAPALRATFPHAVEVLGPPEYNAAHARLGNVNLILSEAYARVIGRLAQPGSAVVIDQFARDKGVLDRALSPLNVELFQAHRGERNPAVAAASVLAREAFLVGLHELSEEFGVDLRKGAGDPAQASARRFVEVHGIESLPRVAKVHFANTRKLTREGPG